MKCQIDRAPRKGVPRTSNAGVAPRGPGCPAADSARLVAENPALIPGVLQESAELSDALCELNRCHAQLFVVCRDSMYDLLTADVVLPLIHDEGDQIAARYDMLLSAGTPLWGHCVIDGSGTIRRYAQCDVPDSTRVADLVYYVQALAHAGETAGDCD